MRALDSNLLLRYITQDDSTQTPLATRYIETELTSEDRGYVSLPVFCEVIWSLRRVYGFSSIEVSAAVAILLRSAQLLIADEAVIARALQSDADLPDAIIHELGRQAGCSGTVTFDRRFARLAGVTLLSG